MSSTDVASARPDGDQRARLTRDRVLGAALEVADRHGLEAVTMREVGDALGVEAMALYRHVRGKDDLLAGLVDAVVLEINEACDGLPEPADPADWRAVVRRRILTAREVILRHPWAPALISAHGTLDGQLVRYFDRLIGEMMAGGCSTDLVHRGMHALGSRGLGFSPELFAPDSAAAQSADVSLEMMAEMAAALPHLSSFIGDLSHEAETTVGWCDDQAEFEFGLDLILDGLEARRLAA